MVRFTQQGCLGQPQKEAGKENRKWWCFPSDQLLYFPELILCPDALSQMDYWGKNGVFMTMPSWLWVALLFQMCHVSPAHRKKRTSAITCLPRWTTIFSASFEENDLMSLILPLPQLLPVTARRTARCWTSQQPRSLLGVLRTLSLLPPTGKTWGMLLLPSPLSFILGRKSPNDPDFRKMPISPPSSVFEIHGMFQVEFFQHGHCH